jgi:hypothetical protein
MKRIIYFAAMLMTFSVIVLNVSLAQDGGPSDPPVPVQPTTCPAGYELITYEWGGDSSYTVTECQKVERYGCNPEEQARLAGTDLEGKMTSTCDGSAYEPMPISGGQKEQIDRALGDVIESYEQTIGTAENFTPNVTVDDVSILTNVQATEQDISATGPGGSNYVTPVMPPYNDPQANYIPPYYDPAQPCTWPAAYIEQAQAASRDCTAIPAGMPTRALCESMASNPEPLDCTGYAEVPMPDTCAEMFMYEVNGVCQCDDPDTVAAIEPCASWSNCAATRTWQAPSGECVANCATRHPLLIEAPGNYCTCVDDPNTDYVETCLETASPSGSVCPYDGDLYVQNDGFSCGCDNPTTPASECVTYIGMPGDICPPAPPPGGGGGGGGGCFAAATDIMMEDGTLKKIVDLKIGDRVMSFDKKVGAGSDLVGNRVTHIFLMGEKDVYDLRGTLVTGTHKFLTGAGEMVAVQDLKAGDMLVLADGTQVPSGELKIVGHEPVYNFTVENAHSYVADGIRTGNMTIPSLPEGVYTESDLKIDVVMNAKN